MFVRGGYVWPGLYLRYASYRGFYRSSVGRGSDYAYYQDIDLNGVTPSANLARYYGQSVRCVALGD